MQSAVTRRSLLTGKVYSPELRISVAEAVRMFTINAVWQERMEDKRGALSPEKLPIFKYLTAIFYHPRRRNRRRKSSNDNGRREDGF